jgi:hypothetical protein
MNVIFIGKSPGRARWRDQTVSSMPYHIYISIGVLVLNCRTIQNEGDKIQCVTYCKFFNTRLDVQALRRLCVWLLSVP